MAMIEKLEEDNYKRAGRQTTAHIELLKQFDQIILQGPPGTGKTYEAKQIAEALTGEGEKKQDKRWKLIQFHPSYNYEDFVRGIQISTEDGKTRYETVDRVLMQITKEASNDKDPENPYLLIIDEINRANVAAVLGELIYALEYRDETVHTPYKVDGKAEIVLPQNLYIIGTMNTADRTIGQIDYAVRRRFAFISLQPDCKIVEGVSKAGSAVALFKMVADLFKEDGEFLSSDYHADDVAIGHSYFIANDDEILKRQIEFQVIPMLEEYVKDGVLTKEAKEEIEKIKNFSYGKNTNNLENSEKNENRDLTNEEVEEIEEIEKVEGKLPIWAAKSQGCPHRMLCCFLELQQKTQDGITKKAFKEAFKKKSIHNKEFNNNYPQMSNISPKNKNHGKVFEKKGDFIEIWEPVYDYVKEFAKDVGIPWKN